ncbi:MAG: hypothetical protein WCS03_09450 [Bacteroidota bacterium]
MDLDHKYPAQRIFTNLKPRPAIPEVISNPIILNHTFRHQQFIKTAPSGEREIRIVNENKT